MTTTENGKFIALYGINGIGKTTQTDLLVSSLRSRGIPVVHVKYPVYDLAPEGPFLYNYLRSAAFREEHKLTTHELQLKFAENRKRYDDVVKKQLAEGQWIIAEDYVGTGIAWGLAWGGALHYLEEINEGLLQSDLTILLDGDRVLTFIEKCHVNEGKAERLAICRSFLLLLGEKHKWRTARANQRIADVHKDIMQIVEEELLRNIL